MVPTMFVVTANRARETVREERDWWKERQPVAGTNDKRICLLFELFFFKCYVVTVWSGKRYTQQTHPKPEQRVLARARSRPSAEDDGCSIRSHPVMFLARSFSLNPHRSITIIVSSPTAQSTHARCDCKIILRFRHKLFVKMLIIIDYRLST